MLVRMTGFGNLRVETKWQSESLVYLIEALKLYFMARQSFVIKGLIHINAILYNFGHTQLIFAPKLTLRKLK